jgi:hypothetical protein
MQDEITYTITTNDKTKTFLATALTAPTPQALLEYVTEAVNTEMTYWSNILVKSNVLINGTNSTYEATEYCLQALDRENNALENMTRAIEAEHNALWSDASINYARAQFELNLALSDWTFALSEIAHDSAFDTYIATATERAEHKEAQAPTRTSYADLLEISPLLYHAYLSIDRLHSLGLSLVRYQMHHLNTHLLETQQQQA